MRSRMRLSALATERISSGPRSGRGSAAPSRLKFSAALAKDDSGAVNARAAHRPSSVTLMKANISVIIHGPPQNRGRGRSVDIDAEIMVPSGNATPMRWAPSLGRERNDPVAAAETAMQAVQVLAVACRSTTGAAPGARYLDVELREGARDIGGEPRPLGRLAAPSSSAASVELARSAVGRRVRTGRAGESGRLR